MKKKALSFFAVLSCVLLSFGIFGCETHAHTYSSEWKSDATGHWHEATCEHKDQQGDKTAHQYGEWSVTEPATCGETGLETKSCTVCGYSVTSVIEATGAHNWQEGTVTQQPTCETAGKRTDTCSECDATKEVTLAKHSHALVATEAVDATCETAGNIAYYTCGDCQTKFLDATAFVQVADDAQLVVAATGHSATLVKGKEATCEAEGVKDYYACKCGKNFEDAAATKEITDLTTLVIAKKACVLVKTEATAPTCEKAGNVEYWTCLACGKVYLDAEGKVETQLALTAVAKAPHTLTKVDAVAATCTEGGNVAYYTCSVCDKWFTNESGVNEIKDKESVKTGALDHEFATKWDKDETNHWHECVRCDEKADEAAHAWNDGVVYRDPTCVLEGVKLVTCEECGEIKKVAIDKVAHVVTKIEAVPHTCTEDGTIEYFYCESCHKNYADEACTTVLAPEDMIDPAAHDIASDWSKNATYHWKACANCDIEFEKEKHEFVQDGDNKICSVCGRSDVAEHDCKFDGEWIYDEEVHWKECTANPGCVEVGNRAYHTWDEGVVTTEPNCTETGIRTHTCTVCPQTKEEVEPIKHTWKDDGSCEKCDKWQEYTLSGVVTDAEGAPLAGVEVKAVGGETFTTTTAEDGSYTVQVSVNEAVVSFAKYNYFTKSATFNNMTEGAKETANAKLVKALLMMQSGKESALTMTGLPTALEDTTLGVVTYSVYNFGNNYMHTGDLIKDGESFSYTLNFNGASEGKVAMGSKADGTYDITGMGVYFKNQVDYTGTFFNGNICSVTGTDWALKTDPNNPQSNGALPATWTTTGKQPFDFNGVRNLYTIADYTYAYDFLYERVGNAVKVYGKMHGEKYWVLIGTANVTKEASDLLIGFAAGNPQDKAFNYTISNVTYGKNDAALPVWDYAEIESAYGNASKNDDGTYDVWLNQTHQPSSSGANARVGFKDTNYNVAAGKLVAEAHFETMTSLSWCGTGVGFSLYNPTENRWYQVYMRGNEITLGLGTGHSWGTRVWSLNGSSAGVMAWNGANMPASNANGVYNKYDARFVYEGEVLTIYVSKDGDAIDESKDLLVRFNMKTAISGNLNGGQNTGDLSTFPSLNNVRLFVKMMTDNDNNADRAKITGIKRTYTGMDAFKTAKKAELNALINNYVEEEYTVENWNLIKKTIADAVAEVEAATLASDVIYYDMEALVLELDAIPAKDAAFTVITVTGAEDNAYTITKGEEVLSGHVADGKIEQNLKAGTWTLAVANGANYFGTVTTIEVVEAEYITGKTLSVSLQKNIWGTNYNEYFTLETDNTASDIASTMQVHYYKADSSSGHWTTNVTLADGQMISFRTTLHGASEGKLGHAVHSNGTYFNDNRVDDDSYIKHAVDGTEFGLNSGGKSNGGSAVKTSPLASVEQYVVDGTYYAYDMAYVRVGNTIYLFVKMAEQSNWVNISKLDKTAAAVSFKFNLAARGGFAQNYTYSNFVYNNNAAEFYNANKNNVAETSGSVIKGEGSYTLYAAGQANPVFTEVKGDTTAGYLKASTTISVVSSGPYAGVGFAVVDPATGKFANITTNANTGGFMLSTLNGNGHGRRLYISGQNAGIGVTHFKAPAESINVSNITKTVTYKAEAILVGTTIRVYLSNKLTEIDNLVHVLTVDLEKFFNRDVNGAGGQNMADTHATCFPLANVRTIGAFAFSDKATAVKFTDYKIEYVAAEDTALTINATYNKIVGNGTANESGALPADTEITLKGAQTYTATVGADGKATYTNIKTGVYDASIPGGYNVATVEVGENTEADVCFEWNYLNESKWSTDESKLGEGEMTFNTADTDVAFNSQLKVVYAEMNISYSGAELAADKDEGQVSFRFANAEGNSTFGGHHANNGKWRTRWGDKDGWSGLGDFTANQLTKFKNGEGVKIALVIDGGEAYAYVENDAGVLVKVGTATKTTGSTKILGIGSNIGSSKATNIKYSETLPDWYTIGPAKTAKIAEIDALVSNYNQALYSTENWTTLTGLVSDAKAAVNALTTTADVKAYDVATLKASLDAIEQLQGAEVTVNVTGADTNAYTLTKGEAVFSGKVENGVITETLLEGEWTLTIEDGTDSFGATQKIVVATSDYVAGKTEAVTLEKNIWGTTWSAAGVTGSYSDPADKNGTWKVSVDGQRYYKIKQSIKTGELISFKIKYADKWGWNKSTNVNAYDGADAFVKNSVLADLSEGEASNTLGINYDGWMSGGTQVHGSGWSGFSNYNNNWLVGDYSDVYEYAYLRVHEEGAAEGTDRVYLLTRYNEGDKWYAISYKDVTSAQSYISVFISNADAGTYKLAYDIYGFTYATNAVEMLAAAKANGAAPGTTTGQVAGNATEGAKFFISNNNLALFSGVTADRTAQKITITGKVSTATRGATKTEGVGFVVKKGDTYMQITTQNALNGWMMALDKGNGWAWRNYPLNGSAGEALTVANGLTIASSRVQAVNACNKIDMPEKAVATFSIKLVIDGGKWTVSVAGDNVTWEELFTIDMDKAWGEVYTTTQGDGSKTAEQVRAQYDACKAAAGESVQLGFISFANSTCATAIENATCVMEPKA